MSNLKADFPNKFFLILFLAGFCSALLPLVFLTSTGEPVSYRVFFWDSTLSFVATFFGFCMSLFGFLWRKYRLATKDAFLSPLFFGLSFACLLAGFSEFRIRRPAPVPFFVSEAADLSSLERDALQRSRAEKRPVIYYFYADWCEACPDFERFVLGNPLIAPLLPSFLVVKLDVSDIERFEEHVQLQYAVTGLPALAFRDSQGRLLRSASLVGEHLSIRELRGFLEQLRNSQPGEDGSKP